MGGSCLRVRGGTSRSLKNNTTKRVWNEAYNFSMNTTSLTACHQAHSSQSHFQKDIPHHLPGALK